MRWLLIAAIAAVAGGLGVIRPLRRRPPARYTRRPPARYTRRLPALKATQPFFRLWRAEDQPEEDDYSDGADGDIFGVDSLRLVVGRLGLGASEGEVAEAMQLMDSNNDGRVSLSEFKAFVVAKRAKSDDAVFPANDETADAGAAAGDDYLLVDDSSVTMVERLRRALRGTSATSVEDSFKAISTVGRELSSHDPDVYEHTYDASDWCRLLRSWPSSFVVQRVKSPLRAISAWAFAVAVLHACCGQIRCAWLWGAEPGVGLTRAMSFVGSALSLLLVFRTNTAYARFWEGRQIWEKLSSNGRNLAEFVAAYEDEVGRARVDRMADLLCAFPIALHLYLQRQPLSANPLRKLEAIYLKLLRSEAKADAKRGFDKPRRKAMTGGIRLNAFVDMCRRDAALATTFSLPSDVDAIVALRQLHRLKFGSARPVDGPVTLRELEAYYNPLCLARLLASPGHARTRAALERSRCAPLDIARALTREAKAIPYAGEAFTPRERIALLGIIGGLRECVAAAERVANTPVPLHYARHLSRFLSLWCLALPLALVGALGFIVVPVTAFVVWVFYGLREIGTLIENPFARPLQLQIVSDTLALDVRDAVNADRDIAAFL
ncbi:Bestrophin, RFP-TM, chloride channel-domain-containing protein [Pelagophyceae sp. CCMP2097]|nr:Bestrophin, RFP-TM, chloride channel-domain-containing protein [Pelagophyceae sp. CCMP2097]